ncbi:hypothetical protein [Reichenbachiella sp.]|uniref:hypothetical protein n=1 Tax=Reichenbachiella sp. TaxID=2184521 RepID=UPI003BAE2D83
MRIIFILALFNCFIPFTHAQVAYSYEGDFNEEGTSFGLRVTSSSSAAGHTHLGDYLINFSSRNGGELYHLRVNSEYNNIYNFHLERISGQTNSNDVNVVENTSTALNLEIRYHGPENDWHRVTVHELSPSRGSNPTFQKIDPSEFQSGGQKLDLISKNGQAFFTSRVGIGTSSPATKLDIRHGQAGGIAIRRKGMQDELGRGLYLTGGGYIKDNDWGGITAGVYHDLGTYTARSNAASGVEFKNGNIYLKAANGLTDGSRFSFPSRLAVLANGNVGIGTTTPTALLSVAGTMDAREIKVEVEAGVTPDYVFADDYSLSSLEETASYIEENHHLPEIPSAKEMEANGMNVGEINLLLLKKIEELTLHLIEMKGKNTELEHRINRIEKNNK